MTALDGLNPDFRDLLVALLDEDAEFLIVGAFAVAFHGAPRATGDLDVVVRPSPENARRVWRALVRFGAPIQSVGLTEQDLARAGTVYQIGLPPRRIDVLTELSGLSFDEAWESREAAQLGGRRLYFLGRAALIRNKLATGRPKDVADVASLKGE